MGDVSWFLGQRYDWHTAINSTVSRHISQQAFIDGLLEKFNIDQCRKAQSPYRSGLKIDPIEHNGFDPKKSQKLVHEFQSLIGGLN